MAIKQEKNYPENPHHNSYSPDYGWEYLGSDDKYDYYQNPSKQWLSIVYGIEGWEYISPDWDILTTGDETNMIRGTYNKYPHTQLRELMG